MVSVKSIVARSGSATLPFVPYESRTPVRDLCGRFVWPMFAQPFNPDGRRTRPDPSQVPNTGTLTNTEHDPIQSVLSYVGSGSVRARPYPFGTCSVAFRSPGSGSVREPIRVVLGYDTEQKPINGWFDPNTGRTMTAEQMPYTDGGIRRYRRKATGRNPNRDQARLDLVRLGTRTHDSKRTRTHTERDFGVLQTPVQTPDEVRELFATHPGAYWAAVSLAYGALAQYRVSGRSGSARDTNQTEAARLAKRGSKVFVRGDHEHYATAGVSSLLVRLPSEHKVSKKFVGPLPLPEPRPVWRMVLGRALSARHADIRRWAKSTTIKSTSIATDQNPTIALLTIHSVAADPAFKGLPTKRIPATGTERVRFPVQTANEDRMRAMWANLTKREQEVLQLVGRGATHEQVANALGVSRQAITQTVQAVRKKIPA